MEEGDKDRNDKTEWKNRRSKDELELMEKNTTSDDYLQITKKADTVSFKKSDQMVLFVMFSLGSENETPPSHVFS